LFKNVSSSQEIVGGWHRDIAEKDWTGYKAVEDTKGAPINLRKSRAVSIFQFSSSHARTILNLQGNTLTITSSAIYNKSPFHATIENGYLTSSSAYGSLFIYNYVPGNADLKDQPFNIAAAIIDNGSTKVSVHIGGITPNGKMTGVLFSGDRENTFSGDLNVVGNVKLALAKERGKQAVHGNVNIRDGARVRILRNEQIGNGSRVSLISSGNQASELQFNHLDALPWINESISELYVEGKGAVDFASNLDAPSYLQSTLTVKDLIITEGSTLLVRNWVDGRNRFLVSKNNSHAADALRKIDFIGYDRRTVGMRDYNTSYWEIFAIAPEPSTYGALSAAGILSLTLLRKLRTKRYRTEPTRCSESSTE